jgi:predicted Zn-dependent protease
MLARGLFYRTIHTKIYTTDPDIPAGIAGIERSLALDDSCFFVSLELGNQYLKIGNREDALRAYRISYERAPRTDSIYDLLAEQIKRVESEPLESISPVRNPGIE